MSQLDALLEPLRLKGLDRAGWLRHDIVQPESVAAHSWGVAWLVLNLLPPHLDRGRALTYAVLHDLPEVRVGDITPRDGISREAKAAMEARAMADLCAPLERPLEATFHAYEAQSDPEARFVRQLDRLDMALQAVLYQDAHPDSDLSEFVESALKVVTHPSLRPLALEARERITGP